MATSLILLWESVGASFVIVAHHEKDVAEDCYSKTGIYISFLPQEH